MDYPDTLVTELSSNILSTVASVVILFALYMLGLFLIKRRFKIEESGDERLYHRYKARLQYTLIGIFVFLLTKVWVDGFAHLVTILGLVSAALVITNKELIMNLVGWLIINWRALFTEHDYIQIGQYTGYVSELGVLYFKMLEGSTNDSNLSTGRVVRVPNGLVINTPVVNFSERISLIEYTQSWYLTFESDFEQFQKEVIGITSEVLDAHYGTNSRYTKDWLRKQDPFSASHINLKVQGKSRIHQHEPYGIQVSVYFYCFPTHSNKIINEIHARVLPLVKETPHYELATE